MTPEENRKYHREYNRRWRKAHLMERREYEKVKAREYRVTRKEETNALARKYYWQHREYVLNYGQLRRTGVTREQKSAMLKAQDNLCAICFRFLSPSNLRHNDVAVDHDHKTKKVRAILCSKCNTMIGLSEENIGTLINAAEYLKQHFTGEVRYE